MFVAGVGNREVAICGGCGPGCWCCELTERAFKTGGGAGRALVPLPMSTGRGILPSYLGLCWCNLHLFMNLSLDLSIVYLFTSSAFSLVVVTN